MALPKFIDIYTDGACSGNPGPGGWGAVLIWGNHRHEISGGAPDTTNNRMELMAAIKALECLKTKRPVHITTDSIYVKDGITKWIHSWRQRNWKTASKKPVKNVDLWQQLDTLAQKYSPQWYWVKGHAGHPENDRADALARGGIPQRSNASPLIKKEHNYG